jgi:phenylalanyl-tRNA synthetase beta chain
MRSTLIGSLVNVLRYNLSRKASRVRIFEVGRVFLRDPSVPESDRTVEGLAQPLRVAGLAYGPVDETQWGRPERLVDFFDVKGDVEDLLSPLKPRFEKAEHPAMHPGRCARILLDGQVVGHVGELHPKWRQAYELPQAPVVFELDAEAAVLRPLPEHQPIPKHQGAQRDLAFIVGDQVTHDALVAAIRQADPEGLVRDVKLFDVYRPKAATPEFAANERSMAVRLSLLDDAATLTDERIDAVLGRVVSALNQGLGARLRG